MIQEPTYTTAFEFLIYFFTEITAILILFMCIAILIRVNRILNRNNDKDHEINEDLGQYQRFILKVPQHYMNYLHSRHLNLSTLLQIHIDNRASTPLPDENTTYERHGLFEVEQTDNNKEIKNDDHYDSEIRKYLEKFPLFDNYDGQEIDIEEPIDHWDSLEDEPLIFDNDDQKIDDEEHEPDESINYPYITYAKKESIKPISTVDNNPELDHLVNYIKEQYGYFGDIFHKKLNKEYAGFKDYDVFFNLDDDMIITDPESTLLVSQAKDNYPSYFHRRVMTLKINTNHPELEPKEVQHLLHHYWKVNKTSKYILFDQTIIDIQNGEGDINHTPKSYHHINLTNLAKEYSMMVLWFDNCNCCNNETFPKVIPTRSSLLAMGNTDITICPICVIKRN